MITGEIDTRRASASRGRCLFVLPPFLRRGQGRFRQLVTKALALTPRGFIRHDVLRVSNLSGQLQVEWRAREIHPWDRELPSDQRAELFREQTFLDTDAAIIRLFQMLPEINAIDFRVLEPDPPNRLVLAGTVVREDAIAALSHSSPRMRLKIMGVRCHIRDGHLEPLE